MGTGESPGTAGSCCPPALSTAGVLLLLPHTRISQRCLFPLGASKELDRGREELSQGMFARSFAGRCWQALAVLCRRGVA